MSAPVLPPLLTGHETAGDPFPAAVALARAGVEAGTLVWTRPGEVFDAALVLAPECALEPALVMVPALANGLADAFGALVPPEVGMQFAWPDGILVNGGQAGLIRVAAGRAGSDAIPEAGERPDWLVIAVTLQFGGLDADPGMRPHLTALVEEGCGDLDPMRLLESWARHLLVWINMWDDAGPVPVLAAWEARLAGLGTLRDGARVLGLDACGGLRSAVGITPLSAMLAAPGDWREISA